MAILVENKLNLPLIVFHPKMGNRLFIFLVVVFFVHWRTLLCKKIRKNTFCVTHGHFVNKTRPTGPKVSVSDMRSNLSHPIPDPNIILAPYMRACSTNFSTNTTTIMQIHKWRHITKIYVDLYPKSRPLLISMYNRIWWIIFRQNPLKIKLYMIFQALFAQPLYAHPFYTLFYNL